MAAERRQPRLRRDGDTLLRRRAIRLRARGVVTLIVGAFSFVLAYAQQRPELLVVASIAFLLVVVGVLVVRFRRPQFEIVRLFSPPVVAADGLTRVTVRVRNIASTASTPLRWNDAIPWPTPTTPHELPSIPVGSASRRVRSVDYELTPPRRGIYPIGPFVVEFEDPFGMATSVQAVGNADRLVVVPGVVELPTGGPTLADGEGTAQLVQRRITGNDDDLTTREYRWGDALRRVHWRASARHGELMVRQEEPRSHPDARIVVDTRQTGYTDAVPDPGDTWSPSAHSEAFEWVIKMTASLGAHLEASGFRVAIEETGIPQVEGLGDQRQGGRRSEGFLTSLAGVKLLDRRADPIGKAVVADADGPVFALLGDPEDDTVAWVLRRRRSGQAAVVFLVDARSDVHKRFTEAGWQCIGVDQDADLGDAWRSAASETGYVRGTH
jgi:uncharacterized protein (DUF58 family)